MTKKQKANQPKDCSECKFFGRGFNGFGRCHKNKACKEVVNNDWCAAGRKK